MLVVSLCLFVYSRVGLNNVCVRYTRDCNVCIVKSRRCLVHSYKASIVNIDQIFFWKKINTEANTCTFGSKSLLFYS